MTIGFNKLQELILDRSFKEWLRSGANTSVTRQYRRARAMAAFEGKNVDDFAVLEKLQQQAFLDQRNNKDKQ